MKYVAKSEVLRKNIFFPSKLRFLENTVIQNFQINSLGSSKKYIVLIFLLKSWGFSWNTEIAFLLISIDNIMVPVQCPNNSKLAYISTKKYFYIVEALLTG